MRIAKYNTSHPRGEAHHKAQYEKQIVEAVRDENDAGVGYKRLSVKYGVPWPTIRDWCTYRTRVYG